MTAEPLSNLDRSTLRERALEALRSAITSGQYRPGDHLGEVELAATWASAGARCARRCATCSRKGCDREQPQHAAGQHDLPEGGPGAVPRAGGAGGARRLGDHRLAGAGEGRRDVRKALSRLADTDGDFATRLEADLGFHLQLCTLGQRHARRGVALPRGPHPRHDHELRVGRHPVDDGADPARPDRRRDRARRRGSREVGGRAAHGGRRAAVRAGRATDRPWRSARRVSSTERMVRAGRDAHPPSG